MANNQSTEIDVLQIIKELWAHRRKLIWWGIGGLAVGIVIAFSIPKEYLSFTQIAPESKNQNNVMNSLGGLASMVGVNVGSTVNEGITEAIYPDIMSSSPFLSEFEDIVVDYNDKPITVYQYLTENQKASWWRYILSFPHMIGSWFSTTTPQDSNAAKDVFRPTAVQEIYENQLKSRMGVTSDKKTGLIAISVKMQDPEIAAVIADSAVMKLKRYMIGYYTSKSRMDLESNKQLLKEARMKYYELDSLYAAVQDRNQSLTSKSAQAKVQRIEDEKDIAFAVYQQLASQVEMNKIKLQEDTPILTVIEPARVPLRASSPHKKIIVLSLTILGVFIFSAAIVIKQLIQR